METATLIAFLTWVVKNAPSFVNDMRLLINGWAAETGADPAVLLRCIEKDTHKVADAEIDAKLDATYATVSKVGEQGSTEDGGP